jgi:hypothetical protein
MTEKLFTLTFVERFESNLVTRKSHGITGATITPETITVTFDSETPYCSETFPVFGELVSATLTEEIGA